ncbi:MULTISPECIES: enoyl-CoA hydratase [Bacillus]|uniref:enoyl-CoA hydratase n=1 Tax=Bacillus TaxID=1386 RepID=UPI0002DA804C|nr:MULTISPECIES: enoyl-CoA hydratase [Bacillus]
MEPAISFISDEKGIATITLQREAAANSLNSEILQQLNATLDDISVNPSIRCVILTGTGQKAFCAGADLKERKKMISNEVKQTVALIGHTFTKLETLPQPVIAAINGVALGGGLEMALACDIRISVPHAIFGLPETSLAIIPGAGGTQRLPRLIGIAKAKELIFTAAKIDSNEALQIGLISKIVDYDSLLIEANQYATNIIQNGPIALKQAKRAIHYGMDMDLQSGLKLEEICYEATIPTKDRLEGLLAFSEKRKPIYKGE